MLADPFLLAILTSNRGAGHMTQNSFIFTKWFLMVLAVALSLAFVFFLEVTI